MGFAVSCLSVRCVFCRSNKYYVARSPLPTSATLQTILGHNVPSRARFELPTYIPNTYPMSSPMEDVVSLPLFSMVYI